MKSRFLERRYSKQMMNSQMGRDEFGQWLKTGSKQVGVGVPFIITYGGKLKRKCTL